jgi:peptide-methionine (S)-S-oxide reductase
LHEWRRAQVPKEAVKKIGTFGLCIVAVVHRRSCTAVIAAIEGRRRSNHERRETFSRSVLLGTSALACGALALTLMGGLSRAGSTPRAASANVSTAKASTKTPKTTVQVPAGKEVATLAAGCFWSMEAMYEQLQGVEKVEPGYAGGKVANPGYERVGEGNTGHAEAVNIIFDPKQISYRQLLQVMLTMRDPTTLNRQGPDAGTNYRSVIFTHDSQQQKTAVAAIREVAAPKSGKTPS